MQDTSLRELFTTQNVSANKAGDLGEEGFAKLILKILENNLSELEESAAAMIQKELNNLGTKQSNIVVGAQQASVELSETMVKLVEKNQLKTIKDTKQTNKGLADMTRLYFRSGKSDIDTSFLQGVAEWTPQAQKLIGLTASVKNYKDFLIKLEKLNVQKAYLAVVPSLKNISEDTAEKLYEAYYVSKKNALNEIVTAHLDHISSIYALTGYGQFVFQPDSKEIVKKYSRFLMYNNPKARIIKVKSTHQIVSDLMEDPSKTNKFSISKSGKVKYLMEH